MSREKEEIALWGNVQACIHINNKDRPHFS